jgi:ABC-type dipeptide/oligopeptide/nickel transport system permease component
MYFLKRILSFIPLLIVITFLAFVLAHSMPGSPFDKERKPASPEIERALKPNTISTSRC